VLQLNVFYFLLLDDIIIFYGHAKEHRAIQGDPERTHTIRIVKTPASFKESGKKNVRNNTVVNIVICTADKFRGLKDHVIFY